MRPPPGSRTVAIAAVAVLALLGLAACGPSVSPSPSAATPTDSPVTATPSPAVSTSPAPSSAVARDAALLGILPAGINGIDVVESPEAETSALADPQLATVGTAMVAGIAVDPPTGEFVYAIVVRLKAGAMDDNVFRDWRDSYDEGACSQASGVAGNAEAQIDGRTVYIGTCSGGVRTYHAWLEAQGILVSASAVGDHRFGELLMNNLRVP